jgi:predicted dehydrogenase
LTAHHFTAFADVDDARAGDIYRAFPSVPHYRDYRTLLDRHHREIDGVVISTPDHLHFPMAIAALEAGKHVYLEKPLCTTIWECRQLAAAAARAGVQTQIGTHGHSFDGLRVLREWLDAGAIGAVHTVILWSSRFKPENAVWSETPATGEKIPETLDWNLWLGPRPYRAYSHLYTPALWRNWWDFGGGPITDIGVHMFDALTYALDLAHPDRVDAETPGISAQTCPPWSKVNWAFPARSRHPAVNVHWFGGTRDGRILKPDDVPRMPRELVEKTENGMAFVGTEGTLFIPDMRASMRPRLFPAEREREFLASPPPRRLRRRKGGHLQDWTDAILDRGATSAPFAYGAALTERVLLGTLAQRTGQPVKWQPETMRADGNPAADALLRPRVREEWESVYVQS